MAVHFAWMTELSESCRHKADTVVSGHAVLHVRPPRPHVYLRVHGLRRLRDRRPPGKLFYEAWLLPSDGRLEAAVSLGLFNASSDGETNVELAWPALLSGDTAETLAGRLLFITAQPNDGLLGPSGESVLLGVIGPPAALPAVVALRPTAAAPAEAPEQSAPVAEPVSTALVDNALSTAPVAQPASPNVVPVAPLPGDPVPPHAYPAAPPTPAADEPPPGEMAKARPQPPAVSPPGWTFPVSLMDVPRACPAGHRLLTETSAALIPLLPNLRQTTGNVNIHFERGQCLVTVRGVPAPAQWGNDPVTRRPYNVYQAWLRRGRGDEAVSLGFFRRIHHDTYRLQYRGHMPFHAFDTLTVAVADRANATFGSGPALYVATYRHTEPVNGNN